MGDPWVAHASSKGKWWPVALILLGILSLVDYATRRHSMA